MNIIGKPLDRVDGRLKVTGRAPYAAEFALPRMAYGALVQSGIASGRITRFDDSNARKQKGVLGIVSFQNVPKLGAASAPNAPSPALFGGPVVEYSGQHIAVVVADTYERAVYATTLIEIEYDSQTPRVEIEKLENESYVQRNPGRSAPSSRGDLAAGRAAASQVIDYRYETPTEHHNPMEPHGTVATWNGDNLTVYDSTQGVDSCQRNLAGTFGLNVENVRVICPFVGGGFGCKGTTWMHVPIAALAAKVVGRPVKLVLRRQEMFSGHGHRAHTLQDVELGADTSGKLTLTSHKTTAETAMSREYIEAAGAMTDMMYSCPNLSIDYKLVRLNKMQPTYMRAPGEASGSFALECAMDELAEKLNMDPVEFRLRNDTMVNEAKNKPFSSRAFKECLIQGRERFGWSERRARPASRKSGRYLVGYGVAGATYGANFRPSTASIALAQNGSVLAQSASHDLGTGAYTIFTQIVAEELGVPVENVRVELGDTNLPQGVLAGGSATTASTGAAFLDAANLLKSRLVELAITTSGSPLFGKTAAAVKVADGRVFETKNAANGLGYTDVLKAAGQPRVQVTGGTGKAVRDERYSYDSFGAHFAKVRVDLELGQIRVEKMLGIYGAGRIMNAKTARSQMLGGIIWGIGMALHEETNYDPNSGRPVTRNLADYHIPSCADTPEIDVVFVPEEDKLISPIGAKGIGEIGIVGVAASIANAVYNATGKRVRDLPLLPEKLLRA